MRAKALHLFAQTKVAPFGLGNRWQREWVQGLCRWEGKMGRWLELAKRAINLPTIGTLPDHLWRFYVELYMVVYMEDNIPLRPVLAWTLHKSEAEIEGLLQDLRNQGIYAVKELQTYLIEREVHAQWLEKRDKVLERDGFTCAYCGDEANSVDHIIPRSQGGTDDLDNLVAACMQCNCSKGARTPDEAGMEFVDA